MVKFSKIAALAGSALVFAGMAFGQATCATPTSNANFVPSETTTGQVAQLTFVCTGPAGYLGGLINVQIFLSPTLPITSKITASATNTTEAVASVGAIAGGVAPAGAIQGVLTGSSITFNGITLAAGVAPQTVTISNIRVNATSIAVGSGVPPAISETAFISGAGAIPVALNATTVAFVQSGIASKQFRGPTAFAAYPTPGGVLVAGASTATAAFVICTGVQPAPSSGATAGVPTAARITSSTASVIQVNENFVTAFKAAGEAPQVSGIAPAAAGSLGNAPATNDRIKVTFNNVPANVSLFLPVNPIPSQNGAGLAKVQLTTSETGGFGAVPASTANNVGAGAPIAYGGGVAQVAVSSGTGSAVFDVTAEDLNNLDQFNIPLTVVFTSNSVVGSSTPMTATVSYAPIGASQIPNFAVGASSTAINIATFNLCTTSLLFPFVTNQLGFDTGLAISNTSTDPFGSNGATAQSGTCTLNFYGAGAPSPANVTTANIPSGTTFTQVLSGVAAGFQGYIIAQCQFQFAHGFAFVTNGVGANGGLSQGYLAGVIPDTNQKARAADPLSVAVAGQGESLGQ
jgi:hypothetical protein